MPSPSKLVPCAPPIKSKGISTTHSLIKALSKQEDASTGNSRRQSFGTNQFLERRILITKQFAEQQSVELGSFQGELAGMQSHSSLHETDKDLIMVEERSFKDKEQDALSCAKLEEPLGGALGGVNEAHDDIDLNDLHQEEDVVMGKRQMEETFLGISSEKDLVSSERVKAAASRASYDEQTGGTNKQMAPAKICLRKSGSRQVTSFTT